MLKSVRLSLWVTLLGVTALRAASPLTLTVVRGHSMEPTLRPGTVSLLDRSYYRFHSLSRGDIVVLRMRGETLIKRVYALPGERLTLLQYDDDTGPGLTRGRKAPGSPSGPNALPRGPDHLAATRRAVTS